MGSRTEPETLLQLLAPIIALQAVASFQHYDLEFLLEQQGSKEFLLYLIIALAWILSQQKGMMGVSPERMICLRVSKLAKLQTIVQDSLISSRTETLAPVSVLLSPQLLSTDFKKHIRRQL